MKKKIDPVKKYTLIYSAELIIIALVFLVFGILRMLDILGKTDTFHTIFNWITIFGGTYIVFDFFWGLISKKRRARICLLDKALNLPIGIFLIVFDIICFANSGADFLVNLWKYAVGVAFIYLSINYTFQGIYHYKYPLKDILDAAQEELNEETKDLEEKEKTSDDI